jgi:hypothetical protein
MPNGAPFAAAPSAKGNSIMGNRAIIAFEGEPTAIYLHWNGGPESVYAFLDYAEQHAGMQRGWDDGYTVARLVQIIGNFFGGCHSLGLIAIDPKSPQDANPGDGGVNLLGKADPNARRGYRMVARWTRDDRRLSDDEIAAEEKRARAHKYWSESPTMLEKIAEKNDRFFVAKAEA